MTIFFYKGLTKNPEIGNTPVWVLPNIWRLGQVRDTKFGTNVSNEMLLNAAKCQGYSFYRFWVIKGKLTEGVKLPPPTQILVNRKQQISDIAIKLNNANAILSKLRCFIDRKTLKSVYHAIFEPHLCYSSLAVIFFSYKTFCSIF